MDRIARVRRAAIVVTVAGMASMCTAQSPQVLMDDAEEWELGTYCGNPKTQAFVAGDKSRTALSGSVAFDSRGNGFVAAGTFVAIVTKDGLADVLTGQPGFAGNTDGPPGRATFGKVLDIVCVHDDRLYVVDAANFTLRKIERVDGLWQTQTMAGVRGRQGHRDGPGRQALFRSTFDSVATHKSGALYLFSGNYIRKYENGTVSTLNRNGRTGYVNGPLDKAQFFHSQGAFHGLTCGGDGNLYVADKANIAIRKVDLDAGMVTTFAGRGPDDGRGKPRDGKALDARFHPGGGPNVIYYNPVHKRFIVRSDDERTTRVIYRRKGEWVVHTLAGRRRTGEGKMEVTPLGNRPCGIDPEGNIYLLARSSIRVLRHAKTLKD